MQFVLLETYFQNCETHLDTTNSRNTEIESYFVQYLLTRICAEYENRIRALIERRCARGKDGHLKQFATRSAKDTTKQFNIGDIKGTLGRFGDDYKNAFDGSVMNTPAHVAWDNIYSNRQAVAHGAGAQMTFPELKQAYSESLKVLDSLVGALHLRHQEIKHMT